MKLSEPQKRLLLKMVSQRFGELHVDKLINGEFKTIQSIRERGLVYLRLGGCYVLTLKGWETVAPLTTAPGNALSTP